MPNKRRYFIFIDGHNKIENWLALSQDRPGFYFKFYYLQLMSLKACNLEPLVIVYYASVTKGGNIFVTEKTVKAYRKLQRCQGRKMGNEDAEDVKDLEGGEIFWQKC